MGIHRRISIINTQIHHPNVPFKCARMEDGFPHWPCTAGVHICPAVSQFVVAVWDGAKTQSAVERSESEIALLPHARQ